MTVTYQVAGGGHLDVNFWMKGPGERVMNEQKKKDTGTYSFTAEQDGRYTYCFSNEMSTVTGKTLRWVCFPVSSLQLGAGAEGSLARHARPAREGDVERKRWPFVSSLQHSFNVHGVMYVEDDGHTAPIEREIRALSQALEAVKEEQGTAA
jgi:p24 family protein beta-1